MDDVMLTAISTVGFPIVVTFYLLVKFQNTMDNFSNKVDELLQELRKGYYLQQHHPPMSYQQMNG